MNRYHSLTKEEARVINDKGTEAPGKGEYTVTTASGIYVCRKCDSSLYLSDDKFVAACGWPSFDDEVPGAVEKKIR